MGISQETKLLLRESYNFNSSDAYVYRCIVHSSVLTCVHTQRSFIFLLSSSLAIQELKPSPVTWYWLQPLLTVDTWRH